MLSCIIAYHLLGISFACISVQTAEKQTNKEIDPPDSGEKSKKPIDLHRGLPAENQQREYKLKGKKT